MKRVEVFGQSITIDKRIVMENIFIYNFIYNRNREYPQNDNGFLIVLLLDKCLIGNLN